MSEPALDTARKRTSSGKTPTQPAPQPSAGREPHPIGDTCVNARIVGRQQEGKRVRLLMAVPRGADVRIGGTGHVVGVSDSLFEIKAIVEGNFAVAYTYSRVDVAVLESHSTALLECQPTRTRAKSLVTARIIQREQSGGRIKITLAAGLAQGVFRDMKGRLTSPNGSQFTIAEVEGDDRSVAFVNATHDELIKFPSVEIFP